MTNNTVSINLTEEDQENILDIMNLCINLYNAQLNDIKFMLNSKAQAYAHQIYKLVNCNNRKPYGCKTYNRQYSKHVNKSDDNFLVVNGKFIYNRKFYNGRDFDQIHTYAKITDGTLNNYYEYTLDDFIKILNQDFEKHVVVTVTNYLVGKYTNNLPNFLADYLDFDALKQHSSLIFDALQTWWQANAPKQQDIQEFGKEQAIILEKQAIQDYQEQWQDNLDSCISYFNEMDKPKTANLKIGNIRHSYDIYNNDVADVLVQLMSRVFNKPLKDDMQKPLPIDEYVRDIDFSNCDGLFKNNIIKKIYFCQNNTITLRFKQPEQAQAMYDKLDELYKEHMLS